MPTLNRSTADKMSLKHYRRKMKWRIKAVNHSFQLPDYFAPMLAGRKHARIADLGSGPINMVGDTWPDCEIEMVCSDGLWNEYAELWGDITPHVTVEQQDMESLTYEDDSFDIVHCVNALDHCKDPRKALEEMLRIVKPGGWIYLRHGENEGERMKYHGYHQFNLSRNGWCWYPNGDANSGWQLIGFKTEFKTETSHLKDYPFPEMVVSTFHNV